MERPLRIAVLMGGVSSEREVSLRSGQAVAEALASAGHDVVPVDVVDRSLDMLDSIRPDVAFIALHGEFGEDGEAQAILEAKQIPYTGSGPAASYVGMDKIESKRLFVSHAVPTPDYFVIRSDDDLGEQLANAETLGYPLVCKPSRNGSSCGISVVRDSKEFVQGVCAALDFDRHVLVEKYVKGRELTVGVLDGVALPPIEIVPHRQFFDYEAKYKDTATEYRFQVSLAPAVHHRLLDVSERAFRALGCRQIGRVDVMLAEDGVPYVLEVNTIPGMTARSLLPKAAKLIGMDFIRLCDHIATCAARRMKSSGSVLALMNEELRRVG